jgi:hypothetical protein
MAKKKTDFVSVPEAARIMGCTRVWVQQLLKRRQLDGFKLSERAWAVSRKSVEKNLKQYLRRDPAEAGRPRSKM